MDKLVGFPWNFDEERYWTLLAVYAKNMAAHRQNTILTPVKRLAKVSVDSGGKVTFDFSRLDHWVHVFNDAGVLKTPKDGIIEGEHLASGRYGDSNHTAPIWIVKDGKVVEQTVSAWSEENHQFLKLFLPALQAYLEKTGLLAMYRQHIFDEPVPANSGHYRELARIVRQAAPKLKTIEATHSSEVVGDIDLWVPETDQLALKLRFNKERQQAGDDVWFYICSNPHSPHLNRFIDYPLLKPSGRLGQAGQPASLPPLLVPDACIMLGNPEKASPHVTSSIEHSSRPGLLPSILPPFYGWF
jgi:hypothetical protein